MDRNNWCPESFIQQLGIMVGEFQLCFTRQIIDPQNPHAFYSSITNLDIGTIQTSALEKIEEIEKYLSLNAASYLNQNGHSESETLVSQVFAPGCISSDATEEFYFVLSQLTLLPSLASKYLDFAESYSGIGGFFRSFAKGFTNVFDGAVHIVGKGSTQNENRLLHDRIQKQWQITGQAIEHITSTVKQLTLNKWNNGIKTIIETNEP